MTTTWAIEQIRATPGGNEPAVSTGGEAADHRLAWDGIVDRFLIPWANGNVEVDDDLQPPSPASLRTAVALAYQFRDRGHAPPTDVLPSGNGGVWLENRHGTSSAQIEVLRDGSVEFVELVDNNLVEAVLLPASAFVST